MKCSYCLEEAQHNCALCSRNLCVHHTDLETIQGQHICHQAILKERGEFTPHERLRQQMGAAQQANSSFGAFHTGYLEDRDAARQELEAGFEEMTKEQFIDPMEYEKEESGGA